MHRTRIRCALVILAAFAFSGNSRAQECHSLRCLSPNPGVGQRIVQPASIPLGSTGVTGTWTTHRQFSGDEDKQRRSLRLSTGEFTIRRVRLYRYH